MTVVDEETSQPPNKQAIDISNDSDRGFNSFMDFMTSPVAVSTPPETNGNNNHIGKSYRPRTDRKVKSKKSIQETINDSDDDDKKKKKDEKDNEMKKSATLSEIWTLSTSKQRTRPFLIIGLISAFISGCVYPAMAFFFAQVFEKFTVPTGSDSFMDGIRQMAYSFMGLGVIVFLSMSVQNTLLDAAANDIAHTFQRNYLSLLLQQDTAYFDLTDVAGTAAMIEGEGNKVKKGMGRKMGEGFQFFITMIGGFAYGFYSSWKVSLVILTTLPFMSISTLFLMRMISSQSSAAKEGYEKASEIAYAAISGIRTLLSLNAVGVTIDKYKGATKEAQDKATSREWALGLANGAVMGSMLLGYIAITLFGMWILYDAVSETGCDPSNAVPNNEPCPTTGMDVFGALMGISFAAMGLPQISGAMESLTSARQAAYPLFVLKRRCNGDYNDDFDISLLLDDEVKTATTSHENGDKDDVPLEMLETTHHKKHIPPSKMPPYRIDCSSDTGLKPTSCEGTIDFSNVSFTYPSRPQMKVLDGLSLHVESGKTVALVGKSGCGKSSIMSLMERFYDS